MLNIQSLAVKLPPCSPSSLKCKEGKTYNEKMQFAQVIIHDIYKIELFVVKFLCRHRKSWSGTNQVGLGATLVDSVYIKKLKEDEVVEQQSIRSTSNVEGCKGGGCY